MSESAFKRVQAIFLGAVPSGKVSESHVIKQLENVEPYIDSGELDINKPIRASDGLTMLHVASKHGKNEILKWLMDHGANQLLKDLNGNTALHFSAEQANEFLSTTQLLMDRGVNLHTKNNDHVSALDILRKAGIDISKLDMQSSSSSSSADPTSDSSSSQQQQQLQQQQQGGYRGNDKNLAKLGLVTYNKLSKLFAGLKSQGDAYVRPIQAIVNQSKPLFDSKACPINQAPTGDGRTFLHLAVLSNQSTLVQLLLEHKANPDTQSKIGATPLHVAVTREYNDIALLLVRYGAKLDVATYVRRETPLDICKNKELRDAMMTESEKALHVLPQQQQQQHQPLQSSLLDMKSAISQAPVRPRSPAQPRTQQQLPQQRTPRPVNNEVQAMKQRIQRERQQASTEDVALMVPDLFEHLDEEGNGELAIEGIAAFHRDMHGCDRQDGEIARMLEGMKVRARNFRKILEVLHVQCQRYTTLTWDFDIMDVEDSGALVLPEAREVWDLNAIDPRQQEEPFGQIADKSAINKNASLPDERELEWAVFKKVLLQPPTLEAYTK